METAMTERVTILGVPIDVVNMHEAVEAIRSLLTDGRQHQVCTPNPEMLFEAGRNAAFLSVLRSSSLNVPDGSGLLWAAKKTKQQLRWRVAGIDLLERIADLPELGPVFFLGAAVGVAERAANMFAIEHPQLSIAGTFSGSPKEEEAADIVRRINESGAKTLFVAFGAPAQELWIHRHLASMPTVKLAIGVGGSFNYIALELPRAPMWMRSYGLEWLWRLLLQPRRFPRIVNATVRFPSLVRQYGRESPISAGARTS